MLDTEDYLYDMNKRANCSPGPPCLAAGPCDRSHITKRHGFTLLEITLAVAILGMMSLAIFRFVQSNLTALRVSADVNAAEAQYEGLRDLLTAEWQSLTPRQATMKGEPFKLNDRQRDEIKWNCGAGPGLLTRYAAGDFTVSLRLQPENSKSDRFDLRLNTWIDRWSDGGRLPRLIKLIVERADATTPWEAIIPLSRTPY